MNPVAFLQNQWFKNPERIKQIIARTTEREAESGGRDAAGVREFYIASFLFFGCLTGKRLKAALGEELCGEIIWEEVSHEIGGKSSSSFPADLDHMRDVLRRHKPGVVVTFGAIAREALKELQGDLAGVQVVIAPHPTSRGPDVMNQLRATRHCIDAARAALAPPANP